MNRRLFMLATALMALAMFALGSTAATTVASAQPDTCCVRIQNNTDCHVTICVRLAGGAVRCTTLAAHTGARFRFECDENTHFWVADDACGLDHRLVPGECVRTILRGGCCSRACLRRGDDGCYEINIEQGEPGCVCPG